MKKLTEYDIASSISQLYDKKAAYTKKELTEKVIEMAKESNKKIPKSSKIEEIIDECVEWKLLEFDNGLYNLNKENV